MNDSYSYSIDPQPDRGRYPKLVVRMFAACYQYRDIPPELTREEEMIAYAIKTSTDLNLKTCLVLSPDRAWYCEPDGSSELFDQPPSGGTIVGENASFVCADGSVRRGSPRGPIVRGVDDRQDRGDS